MTLTSNVKLKKIERNLKQISKFPEKKTTNKQTRPIERRTTTTSFHVKGNYLKKSSIDLNLKDKSEENKENFKKIGDKPKTLTKKNTLSMSTTDFSQISKKTDPKKKLVNTKNIQGNLKRSSMKENPEKH